MAFNLTFFQANSTTPPFDSPSNENYSYNPTILLFILAIGVTLIGMISLLVEYEDDIDRCLRRCIDRDNAPPRPNI